MAILPIRTFGDPVLREPARAVERVEQIHRRLIKDMFETMREAPGVGLAGPQIGVLERIFVWEVGDDSGVAINPRLVETSDDTTVEEEGCLSLPGIVYPVGRPRAVTLEAVDERGRTFRRPADELLARVFQHEKDHLDGILFIDRLPDAQRREARRRLGEQALGLEPTPSVVAGGEEIL